MSVCDWNTKITKSQNRCHFQRHMEMLHLRSQRALNWPPGRRDGFSNQASDLGYLKKREGPFFVAPKGFKKKTASKKKDSSPWSCCTTNVQTLQTMYCDVAKICWSWKKFFRGQRVTRQRKALAPSQLWNGRVVYNKTENPRCSMYGLFTYIWVVLVVNVGKYTIHWASGNLLLIGPYFWGSGSERC